MTMHDHWRALLKLLQEEEMIRLAYRLKKAGLQETKHLLITELEEREQKNLKPIP